MVIHSDNLTIVDIVKTGTSKNCDIMCLVRVLFFICVKYNFELRIEHIPGVEHTAADSLSQLNFDAFFKAYSSYYDEHPNIRCSFD